MYLLCLQVSAGNQISNRILMDTPYTTVIAHEITSFKRVLGTHKQLVDGYMPSSQDWKTTLCIILLLLHMMMKVLRVIIHGN